MTTRTENWKPLEFHCPYECTYCPESEMAYSETPKLRKEWMDIPSHYAIWVCPDTDLFSDDVPSSVIESVLERAAQYSDKGFIFCTRNVKRYSEFLGKFPSWVYLATTAESDINYGCSKAPPPMVRLKELRELKHTLGDFHSRAETCISIKPVMRFTDKFFEALRQALPDQIMIGKELMGIENFPTPRFSEALTLAKKLSTFSDVNIHGYRVSKDTRLRVWPDTKTAPDRFEVKHRQYLRAAFQVEEGDEIK